MGKFFTFFVWAWFIVGIFGGMTQGGSGIVATELTADITATDDEIPVVMTTGFVPAGIIIIGDEKIAYSETNSTNFKDNLLNPMTRGAESTTAAVHLEGDIVYVTNTSILNQSAAYSIATIADSSGLWAALAIGLAILRLVGNFMVINFTFLGADLAMFNYLWIVVSLGLLVAFGLAMAGARRV